MNAVLRSLSLFASQNAGRLANATVLLLLSLLVGLNLLGTSLDRQAYLWQYQRVEDQGFLELATGLDPLYFLALKLASLAGLPFEWITFAIALASLGLVKAAVERLEINHFAFFGLWASHVLWLHNYTQIRIALAIALVLFAIFRLGRARWPVFVIAFAIHAAVAIPIAIWVISRLPKRALAALGVVAAAVLVKVATDFEGVFTTLTKFVPDIGERALLYVDLRDFDVFSEQNLLAVMPLMQSAMVIYILVRSRVIDTVAMLGSIGPVFFYAFSFLPVLAFRSYEMFIPFFLVYLAMYVNRSPLLIGVATLYGLVGLRQIFFTASPVVPVMFGP